jgi:hypothetical protein
VSIDLDRPFRRAGEDDHWRSGFQIGDIVRYGCSEHYLGRIVGWDATWSHLRAGRIAHLEPVGPSYGATTSWEKDLAPSQPDDRFGAHPHRQDCPCGLQLDRGWYQWIAAPASWQVDHRGQRVAA